ncbi:MAG: glycosyltransferase family 4 protein [Acidobacteria bacterium]|nr:glycosyltransferase family 4 protein [Acidobacteriota bacterium]
MTVLQLISSSGYYGAESMLVALSAALRRQGCQCIVGAFFDGRSPHMEVIAAAEREGLPVEAIPCAGRWEWKTVQRIRNVAMRHGIQLLHTHGYKADVYGYLAAAGKGSEFGLVATCHNWPGRKLGMRFYAALDRLCLRGFDHVVAASKPVQERLSARIEAARLSLIGNGVSLERFRNAAPVLKRALGCEDAPLVGFVGRHVAGKGGDLLLAAARRVLADAPTARFVFVGDGEAREEWRALARRLCIEKNVHFAGIRDDMPEVYASFDLMVLPSFEEATPMCLLEGMASGIPVVATRVGSVADVVMPEKTGILVEPGDVDGLAAGIARLLSRPEEARRLARGGCEHVRRHYSAESMAERYLHLYECAAGRRGVLVGRAACVH